MSDKVPGKQLLHLVLGGELANLHGNEFKDLDKVDMVGVYPNYVFNLTQTSVDHLVTVYRAAVGG